MINVIIPARLASTRLPNKLLLDETGHPVLWHTIQRVLEAQSAKSITVLADDPKIVEAINHPQVKVVLTAPARSGTERIARYCQKWSRPSSLIVNFQGDEPELPGYWIDKVVGALTPDCEVATVATPITAEAAQNPNAVKVVLNHKKEALYFSRSPIPYGAAGLRHIGLYAYRVSFLQTLRLLAVTTLPSENLEQLRWLQAGVKIRVVVGDIQSTSVDVLTDYQEFKQRWLQSQTVANSTISTG